MAAERVTIRGVTVTDELYDLILFVDSLVRPPDDHRALRNPPQRRRGRGRAEAAPRHDPQGQDGVQDGEHDARRRVGLRAHPQALPRRQGRGLPVPAALRQPLDGVPHLPAAVQRRAGARRASSTTRSRTPTTRSTRCATRRSACGSSCPRAGQHLQPRQERRDERRADRALLRAQPAALKGDGEEPADLRERVNAPCTQHDGRVVISLRRLKS